MKLTFQISTVKHVCFNYCAYSVQPKTSFQRVISVFQLNLIPNALIKCLIRVRRRKMLKHETHRHQEALRKLDLRGMSTDLWDARGNKKHVLKWNYAMIQGFPFRGRFSLTPEKQILRSEWKAERQRVWRQRHSFCWSSRTRIQGFKRREGVSSLISSLIPPQKVWDEEGRLVLQAQGLETSSRAWCASWRAMWVLSEWEETWMMCKGRRTLPASDRRMGICTQYKHGHWLCRWQAKAHPTEQKLKAWEWASHMITSCVAVLFSRTCCDDWDTFYLCGPLW